LRAAKRVLRPPSRVCPPLRRLTEVEATADAWKAGRPARQAAAWKVNPPRTADGATACPQSGAAS